VGLTSEWKMETDELQWGLSKNRREQPESRWKIPINTLGFLRIKSFWLINPKPFLSRKPLDH